MLSTKSIATILALLSSALLQIQAYRAGTSASTDKIGYYYENIYFKTLNHTRFVTSKVNETFIRISEFGKFTTPPCDIPVEKRQIPVDTAVVADKIVILLADQYRQNLYTTTEYTIVLVNPWFCASSKTIKVDKYDQIYLHAPKDIGFLLPYEDSFDLFFAYQQKCVPCRFSAEGERIQVPYSLRLMLRHNKGYVLSNESENPKNGYNYTYWRIDGSEVTLQLNEKFRPIKRLDENVLEDF